MLYRAIWSDTATTDRDSATERLMARVSAWAQELDDAPALEDGEGLFIVSQGRHRRTSTRSMNPAGFEFIATDQIPDQPTEWVTTIRVVTDDAGIHVLVELSMSSDDLSARISVGRPRIVHDLLVASEKPHLGGSGLVSDVTTIPANGVPVLTEMLGDAKRTLPIIVCAEPERDADGGWLRRARMMATRTEGVAIVVTLETDAVAAFRRAFGDLAVWDGGVRVYVPGPVAPQSDGWRHRYYLRSKFEDNEKSTLDRVVYSVTQLSTRRRMPDSFRVFGEASGLPTESLTDMIPSEQLTAARQQWEFDLEVALDEQSSLERELSHANGHLGRLREALIATGQSDLLWGTQHEDATAMPDEVQDSSEAVIAAQIYLSKWLALPPSAVRELEDVDTTPEAYNWGNKLWRGLRALAAYAEDRSHGWDRGGFWEWCASGPLLGWPATPKKLSMTESETVQNNDRYRRTRVFQIDPAVSPSGELLMLAHLKISEGGGNLAPRVYFHDDTGGTTKRIHVGLVGPHHLVPNKSTN